MRKTDLQALYHRIKLRKMAKASSSFFSDEPARKGCSSCGKSSWRPKE